MLLLLLLVFLALRKQMLPQVEVSADTARAGGIRSDVQHFKLGGAGIGEVRLRDHNEVVTVPVQGFNKRSVASDIPHVESGGEVNFLAAPAPHKDFSDLYVKMSGKGASASETHCLTTPRLPFNSQSRMVAKTLKLCFSM